MGNKYEKSLLNLKEKLNINKPTSPEQITLYEDLKSLEELVDKETPMKVEKDDGCLWWHCPKCKGLSNFYSDYCSSCGQKLDWE